MQPGKVSQTGILQHQLGNQRRVLHKTVVILRPGSRKLADVPLPHYIPLGP